MESRLWRKAIQPLGVVDAERGGWTLHPKHRRGDSCEAGIARSQTSNASMSSTASASQPWQYVGPEGVPTHGGAGRINRLKVDPCTPTTGTLRSFWRAGKPMIQAPIGGRRVDILSPLVQPTVDRPPRRSTPVVGDRDGNGDTYSIGLLKVGTMVNLGFPLSVREQHGAENSVHCATSNHRRLFLVATDLGVFQTSNGGESFDLVLPGLARFGVAERLVAWLPSTTMASTVVRIWSHMGRGRSS